MPKPIKPGSADYHDSVQKFHIMKKCERTMNRAGICKSQRVKAIHKFHEYRNILLGRDYCVKTQPE